MFPPSSRKFTISWIVATASELLREAHRPAADDFFRAHRDLRRRADLFPRQAAAMNDFLPRGRVDPLLDTPRTGSCVPG